MFKCNRCGESHAAAGEPCPPIPAETGGLIPELGKLLESERMKQRALESARILFNALRFRVDWPDEQSVNNAIDTWFEDWKEVFDE